MKETMNFHVTGVLIPKPGKGWADYKDETNLNFGPTLLKSDHEEVLLPRLQCCLELGDKEEVIQIAEKLLKKQEQEVNEELFPGL